MMPRPVPCFRSFVGHNKQVAQLRRQLEGAKFHGEPFPPTLFNGPSGVGKTLLAQSLAAEYGTSLKLLNGYATHTELAATFQAVNSCDFVFIDEMHSLTPKAQELLFHVIDERKVPLWDQNGKTNNQTYVEIPPVSVILATDQPGRILNALDKRMTLVIRLGFYSHREMKEIVDRLATNLNLLITAQAANELAQASLGLPRKAKHHLENFRRHFPGAENRQIGINEVREFLQDFGIDSHGLGDTERDYLRFLQHTKSASLDSLASHLGFDADYVRRQLEPVLTRAELIVIGAGGRRLTEKGSQI